jgi:hypothetical protein
VPHGACRCPMWVSRLGYTHRRSTLCGAATRRANPLFCEAGAQKAYGCALSLSKEEKERGQAAGLPKKRRWGFSRKKKKSPGEGEPHLSGGGGGGKEWGV